MRRRKRKDDSGGASPSWMTTYSDLMSLLLTFFIMLFAFSSIDMQRFREALVSLQGALGVLGGGPALLEPGERPIPPDDPSQMDDDSEARLQAYTELVLIKAQLEEYLDEKGLRGKIHLEMNKRGLLIRFTDTVLFDLGRASLRPDSQDLLKDVARFIGPIRNEVIVEGHTDNVPLRRGAQYETNWELSTARATTVVRYFIETLGLSPKRFSAAGYGEYRPVLPNTSYANRELNRRVDILIIASDITDIPGT